MGTPLRIRQAVRALVVRPDDAVLLVRFEFPDETVWATPGGGIEDDEEHPEALRRELHEEVGLREFTMGPALWTRTRLWPWSPLWDGQSETFYLVRVPEHFEPAPLLSWDQLRLEGVTAVAWWTPEAMATTSERFTPSRLVELHEHLRRHGPPDAPFDVGV